MKRIALVLAVCTFLGGPAMADLIQNGSFELGNFVPNAENIMTLPVGSTTITGWTVVNSNIAWIKETNPYGILTPNGILLLDLTAYDNKAPFGGVTQTIATTAGQSYALSLDLGVLNGSRWSTLTGPISVKAEAGSTSQTSAYNPAATGNQWQTFGFNFVADSASTPVTITGMNGQAYIGVDNVSVVPVPGAALLAMLGLGAAGVKLRRRCG